MAYNVKIKEHEGPLELLLELIEARKLYITEISLGKVTEEYFGYLESLRSAAREQDTDFHAEIASFLVIAATLMVIKSRALLGSFAITEEEEHDIRELEDRLKAYKYVKEMAAALGAMGTGGHQLFSRQPHIFETPSFLPSANMDLNKMLNLLRDLISSLPPKITLPEHTVKKVISIEERMKDLEARIQSGIVRTFNDFVGQKTEKIHVIVSFLAMLELIKIGSIAVRQAAPFEMMNIEHGTR